jgi:hypothetical protein
MPALQVMSTEILVAPRPLDDKIAEGIAIQGIFCGVQQRMVTERLEGAFEELRADASSEHGSCIAVSIGHLALEVEDEIDELVTRVSEQQNHGMQSLSVESLTQDMGADLVWSGYDPHIKKLLKLYKRNTTIWMNDNTDQIGTLWALKAKAGVSVID